MHFPTACNLGAVKRPHPRNVRPYILMPTLRLQEHKGGRQATPCDLAWALAALPVSYVDMAALLASFKRFTQVNMPLKVVDLAHRVLPE
jgi:hypothetical protein